jgi:hypothetical protein
MEDIFFMASVSLAFGFEDFRAEVVATGCYPLVSAAEGRHYSSSLPTVASEFGAPQSGLKGSAGSGACTEAGIVFFASYWPPTLGA